MCWFLAVWVHLFVRQLQFYLPSIFPIRLNSILFVVEFLSCSCKRKSFWMHHAQAFRPPEVGHGVLDWCLSTLWCISIWLHFLLSKTFGTNLTQNSFKLSMHIIIFFFLKALFNYSVLKVYMWNFMTQGSYNYALFICS